MQQLFDKTAIFGDIHFGKSSNSDDHNQNCEDFVDWMIAECQSQGIRTCIFLGDWHDSRINIQIKTFSYSLRCLEKLDDAFDDVYFIIGNHDIFHRTKRDIHSVQITSKFKNIHLIDEITEIDGVALVPWLVADEWKKVRKLKSKYIFGHFELPNFYMNAMVKMADHGGLNAKDMSKAEYVFSGHFHKRQAEGNVVYVGSPFGHNFADAWDSKRGFAVLEWGGKPKFYDWPDQPLFRTYKLSEIVDEPEKFIFKKVIAKITVDLEMTYEESLALRESFAAHYGANDVRFIHPSEDLEDTEWDEAVSQKSVDQIVLEGIDTIDDDSTYEKTELKKIYNNISIEDV